MLKLSVCQPLTATTARAERPPQPDLGAPLQHRDDHHVGDPDRARLPVLLGFEKNSEVRAETVANVAWGWPKRNRLFMCASQSLYAVYVNTEGAIGG